MTAPFRGDLDAAHARIAQLESETAWLRARLAPKRRVPFAPLTVESALILFFIVVPMFGSIALFGREAYRRGELRFPTTSCTDASRSRPS